MQLPTLRPGNSKLGPLIYQWSIKAGKKHSCPGESGLCASRCYAKAGFYCMPANEKGMLRNFEFTKNPNFRKWLIAQMKIIQPRVFRIHVSGDFYSPEYLDTWLDVVRQNPRTSFFAYTRSWRVDELFPQLLTLSQLPNADLWFSVDRETGQAPLVPGVRRAYMAIDDTDARMAFPDCDLVFRDQTKTVMKKANGVQVCPVENGVKTQTKITCTSCGICWKHVAQARWQKVDMDDIFDEEGTDLWAPDEPELIEISNITLRSYESVTNKGGVETADCSG